MIDLYRHLKGTNETAYVVYQDRPFTQAMLEVNTDILARENKILPQLAAKALNLLFPWDYLP